ncbi:MAG: hypothetical protein Q4A84_02355 [Neisseria sp.]|uniref:hypothetical protein n=1 Tax=Neisseria sp. TaxID=192066 RepID=UPI0026DB2821|nr:hypothetical protein [Neisseria sp.]MDO4640534.1 hypothetical protein [Neisseria sp.]
MSLEEKIDNLIRNIVLLQGKNDQRQKLIETEHWKSKNALDEAGSSLRSTAQGIQKFTADTVGRAVDKPLQAFEQGVEQICREFSVIASNAERQQREAVKRLKMLQWTALTALIAALAISIGSAVFMMKYAHQEIARSDWVGNINKAIDNGSLARCDNGDGICAKVKGKLVRLDK